MLQNDVVLHHFCPKRRRFVIYLKINKKETTSFYRLQRQNDVVSTRRLPKNDFPCSFVQFAASGGRGRGMGGGGGGGERRQGRQPVTVDLDRQASGGTTDGG